MTAARRSRSDRLERYHAKRDFEITGEPRGAVGAPSGGSRFVVQRHRARRLHYDLRLEMDGVLASWAVPKGPTLDPSTRRMAVHVEDHPLEYFDFEGVIPAHQYGAGDVIVWDWGTWSHPDGSDPVLAVRDGNLHFDLFGEKLHGRFVLVRRGARDGQGGQEQWLLLHKHDEAAVDGWDPEDHPRSVKSGRTNDEVRDAPSASWSSSSLWTAPDAAQLADLGALGGSGAWKVGGRQLRLTGLDRIVVAGGSDAEPLTKRDLVRHVAVTAPAMLPYLADRVTDIGNAASRAPAWIRRAAGGVILDGPAPLVWTASRGVVELHPHAASADAPDRPSWLWFALQPDGADRAAVLAAAALYRTAFDHLGLRSGPVLTGSGGVEIWVPIAQRHPSDDVGEWAGRMTAAIVATMPEAARCHADRAPRPVVPFGTHDLPGAPVSVPVTWDELLDGDAPLDGWSVRDVAPRLQASGDPLAPLIAEAQLLPAW